MLPYVLISERQRLFALKHNLRSGGNRLLRINLGQIDARPNDVGDQGIDHLRAADGHAVRESKGDQKTIERGHVMPRQRQDHGR